MEQLTRCRLTLQQAEQIYMQYMKQDFAPDELKPFGMIQEAWARGEYECLGFYDGAMLSGYAYLVRLGREYLLDYFAVQADLRGSGYGSRILQMLRMEYAEASSILIESENPDYAVDASEFTERQRRLRFYHRAGCLDTGVTVRLFGVEYKVLELPVSGAHSPDAIRESYMRLYLSFLSAERCQKHILLR